MIVSLKKFVQQIQQTVRFSLGLQHFYRKHHSFPLCSTKTIELLTHKFSPNEITLAHRRISTTRKVPQSDVTISPIHISNRHVWPIGITNNNARDLNTMRRVGREFVCVLFTHSDLAVRCNDGSLGVDGFEKPGQNYYKQCLDDCYLCLVEKYAKELLRVIYAFLRAAWASLLVLCTTEHGSLQFGRKVSMEPTGRYIRFWESVLSTHKIILEDSSPFEHIDDELFLKI